MFVNSHKRSLGLEIIRWYYFWCGKWVFSFFKTRLFWCRCLTVFFYFCSVFFLTFPSIHFQINCFVFIVIDVCTVLSREFHSFSSRAHFLFLCYSFSSSFFYSLDEFFSFLFSDAHKQINFMQNNNNNKPTKFISRIQEEAIRLTEVSFLFIISSIFVCG